VSRLIAAPPSEDGFDRVYLGAALTLDAVTDRGRLAASPAYPAGGFVRRYADALGVTVDELLDWGESQGLVADTYPAPTTVAELRERWGAARDAEPAAR